MANFNFTASASGGGGNFSDPALPPGSNTGSFPTALQVVTAPIVTAPAAITCIAPTPTGLAAPVFSGANYDASFHEITYRWYAAGAPLSAYANPQNMLSAWNNPNQSFGKEAHFVLPEGTHTLWCIASDSLQNYAIASVQVIVVGQDAAYPTTRTICYSEASDFTGAPAGAQQVSTLAALVAAVQAATSATRVLFKSGETFLDFDLITRASSGSSTGQLQHMGIYGGTVRATLRPPSDDNSNMLTWRSTGPEDQITVENIKVEGYWDATTETGSLAGGSPFYWRDKTTSAVILFTNCEWVGCENQQISCNAAVCDVFIHDCINRGWQDYAYFGDRNLTGRFVFLGCRIAQNPDALNGGQKKGLRNQHACVRITRCRNVYGDCVDMFSNNGWSGNFDTQPCLRVGTNQTDNQDIFLHWGRSVMEGGYQIINLEGENTTAEDNPGNFVFDRCLLISSARQLQHMVSCHKGGATFRNLILFMPAVDGYTVSGSEFFIFDANNSQNSNDDAPIQVYNCTAISLQNAAQEEGSPMAFIGPGGNFTITNNNNVIHIPNTGTPQVAAAPLDMSPLAGITPRYKGVQFNYELINDTMSAVANGATLFIPYSQILIRSVTGDGPGTATNQAYWQAIEGTDTLHGIAIGTSGTYDVYRRNRGHFSVSFDPTGVTITNTSGNTWSGPEFWLALDRKSLLDTELPLQTAFATPPDVPQGRQQAGSSVIASATGIIATTDFLGDYRPVSGRDQGAWQGVGT